MLTVVFLPDRNRPAPARVGGSSRQQRSNAGDWPNDSTHFVCACVCVFSIKRVFFCRLETAAPTGDSEDYVADSEDEATKNFKDRVRIRGNPVSFGGVGGRRVALTPSFPHQLFVKRYCRTKHGTYVPTLREYFRPRMARRDLLSTGGRRR